MDELYHRGLGEEEMLWSSYYGGDPEMEKVAVGWSHAVDGSRETTKAMLWGRVDGGVRR